MSAHARAVRVIRASRTFVSEEEQVPACDERRVCAHEGCGTVLSRYNWSRYCGLHAREASDEEYSRLCDPAADGWHTCTGCGRRLPRSRDYFPPDTHVVDGMRTRCYECVNARARARYARRVTEAEVERYASGGTKCCTRCGRELPATLEYFRSQLASAGGVGILRSHCRDCEREAGRRRYRVRVRRLSKEGARAVAS